MIEPLHGTLLAPREVVAKKIWVLLQAGLVLLVVQNIWKKNLWKYEKSNTKVVMEVNDDVVKKKM